MALTAKAEPWFPRIVTLFIWALAIASVTYWGLRLGGAGSPGELQKTVSVRSGPAADPVAVARLLGGAAAASPAAAPAAEQRFVLLGVVADRASRGAALIAVDGKAGKPYRVGSRVDDNWILQSVKARQARLKPAAGDGAEMVLEMAPLAKLPVN